MGEAVATRLLRDGCDVILFDRRDCRAAAGRIEQTIAITAGEPDTRADPYVDARPETGADPYVDARPETRPDAHDDTRNVPRPDPRPGTRSDGRHVARPGIAPDATRVPGRPCGELLAAFGPLDDPADLRRALPAVLREAGHGPAVDAVVYTLLPDDAFTPRPLASLAAADWDRLAEEPVRWGLTVLQVAHEYLLPRRGRFVFVLPSIALEGGAGLVPLATCAESLRALGKSAARRWAAAGITVNFVVPDVFAYGAEELRGTDVDRGESVLPGPSTAGDVADTVALFLAPEAGRLTGATLTVDGGALMTP
nr:SDR family oxidoreductase [Streptomyces sp. SID3343]